ncbi:MAG: F0F1 ATP synthase subunit B [Pirellulales bacterium]|nr:F0F1 ATP synthase subunit B [Pirellulales bacterium]
MRYGFFLQPKSGEMSIGGLTGGKRFVLRAAVTVGFICFLGATTNVAVAAGGGGGLGPPLNWSNDSAIYTAIGFLLLFLVLWRFAWGPISEGLQKREQGIADHIAAAERQNEEAKGILAQYEAKLADAAGEVRELLEEARRDAEHTKEEIVAAAKSEAQAEKSRALNEINTARDQALKDLAERSADMAVDLAGRIVQAKMTKEDHATLIRDAVGNFAQSKPSDN